MRHLQILLLLFIVSCSRISPFDPGIGPENHQYLSIQSTNTDHSENAGIYWSWGYYQLDIARDGSYGNIIPLRNGMLETYGHHINALKFLESGPCSNCVWIDNIHPTIEGNVSVDVSIKHPFNNPAYTGFDVRGIIMFPASQIVFDDDLRAEAGLDPYTGAMIAKYSSAKKGDAELVNTEGWTRFWEPGGEFGVWTETGYPIFYYYPGKMASGENIGNLNPFIRFHTNDTRHMFEAGKTDTRTYIIKPPAQGPIQACYAVYAHWAEPDVEPVTNPETDFPLDANSCMPYELEIYQDGIIDPDAPSEVQGESIHIRMKHWGVIPVEDDGDEYWDCTQTDYIDSPLCVEFEPHPGGLPDEYWPTIFYAYGYYKLPDSFFPGKLPILYRIKIGDPLPSNLGSVAYDYWIMDIQFGPRDGVW